MRLRNVIFYVKDINKSKRYYSKLGFKISQAFGNFISYDAGIEGLYFSLMESNVVKNEPGKQVCVFWINDIEEFYKKVNKLSLFIDTKLYKATFGQTFAIRDLDGNKIEFVET